MKKYDLTVVVKSDVAGGALDKFVEKIEKIIKALEGKTGKFSEMGKKQLAYKINNVSEANYLNWMLDLKPAAVVELERKLTVDREILRHLLVNVQESNSKKLNIRVKGKK